MSFAHLTLPTTDVEGTAHLLEHALGWKRAPLPPNSPIEVVWLDLGRGHPAPLARRQVGGQFQTADA